MIDNSESIVKFFALRVNEGKIRLEDVPPVFHHRVYENLRIKAEQAEREKIEADALRELLAETITEN